MSSQIAENYFGNKLFISQIQGNKNDNVKLIRVDKINNIDVSDNYVSLDKVVYKSDKPRYYIGLSNNDLIIYDDINELDLIKFNRLTGAIEFNSNSQVIIPDLSASSIDISDATFDYVNVENDLTVNGDICCNNLNLRLQTIDISINSLDLSFINYTIKNDNFQNIQDNSINLLESGANITDISIALHDLSLAFNSQEIGLIDNSVNLLENRADIIDTSVNNITLDIERIDLSLTGVNELDITKRNITSTGDLSAVNVTLKDIEITGNEMVLPEVYILNPAPADNSGEVQIKGNLRVLGTEFITNIEELDISGAFIKVNTDGEIVNSGLKVVKADGGEAIFYFNPTNGKFEADTSVNIPNTFTVQENIGIGTNNPSERLELSGSGNQYIQNTTTGGNAFVKNKTSTGEWGSGVNGLNYAIYDYNQSEYRATILNDGKFGIGTTLPQEKLHVYDADTTARMEVESGANFAFVKQTTPTASYGSGVGNAAGNYYIYSYTDGINRFNVSSDGLISMGDNAGTNTGGQLNIEANSTTDNNRTAIKVFCGNNETSLLRADRGAAGYGFDLIYQGDGTGNNNRFVIYADNSTGGYKAVNAMTILQDGKIGLQIVQPQTNLDVLGDVSFGGNIINTSLSNTIGETGYHLIRLDNSVNSLDNSVNIIQLHLIRLDNSINKIDISVNLNEQHLVRLDVSSNLLQAEINDLSSATIRDDASFNNVDVRERFNVTGDICSNFNAAVDICGLIIGNLGWADWRGLKRDTLTDQTAYALMQGHTGATLLNCSENQFIQFKKGNSAHGKLDPLGNWCFGAGLLNPASNVNFDISGVTQIRDKTFIKNSKIDDFGFNGWSGIGHKDCVDNSYALLQNDEGKTLINAAAGQTLHRRINNVDYEILSEEQLTLGRAAVANYNVKLNGDVSCVANVDIEGNLNVNGDISNGKLDLSLNNFQTVLNSHDVLIGAIDAQVGTNSSNIATNATDITTLDNQMTVTEVSCNQYQANQTLYEASFVAIDTSLNSHQSSIEAADLSLINHEARITTNYTIILGQIEQIDENDLSLIQIFPRVKNCEDDITDIENEQNTQDTSINNFENVITANAGTTNTKLGAGSALGSVTNGVKNTTLGYGSTINLTSGQHNTVVGYEAGKLLQTGNKNTFVGSAAGTTIGLSSQENCVYIGASQFSGGALVNDCSNEILIGANLVGTLGSNSTTIGNTQTFTTKIYGDLSQNPTIDALHSKNNIQDISISSLSTGAGITDISVNLHDLSLAFHSSEIAAADVSINLLEDEQLVQNAHLARLDVSTNLIVAENLVRDSSINAPNITKTNITVTNDISCGGILHGPADFQIDPQATGDNTGKVSILGDLEVKGTTITVHSEDVDISNETITLCANMTGTPPSNTQSGIIIERGDELNAKLLFNEANRKWSFKIGSALAPLNVSELNTGDLEINSVNVNNLFDTSFDFIDSSLNQNRASIDTNSAHLVRLDISTNTLVDISVSHWATLLLHQDAIDNNTTTNNTQNNRLNVIDVSIGLLEDVSAGLIQYAIASDLSWAATNALIQTNTDNISNLTDVSNALTQYAIAADLSWSATNALIQTNTDNISNLTDVSNALTQYAIAADLSWAATNALIQTNTDNISNLTDVSNALTQYLIASDASWANYNTLYDTSNSHYTLINNNTTGLTATDASLVDLSNNQASIRSNLVITDASVNLALGGSVNLQNYSDASLGFVDISNLDVSRVKINDYIFPLSKGTANQYLQTDGTGNVSWVDPGSGGLTGGNGAVFSGRAVNEFRGASNDWADGLRFASDRNDPENCFTPSTEAGIYTTKHTGWYNIIVWGFQNDNGAGGSEGSPSLEISTNGGASYVGLGVNLYYHPSSAATNISPAYVVTQYLEVGDKIRFIITGAGSSWKFNGSLTIEPAGGGGNTYITNSDGSMVNVDISGELKFGNKGSQNTLPVTQGVSGQIMKANGSGTIIWADDLSGDSITEINSRLSVIDISIGGLTDISVSYYTLINNNTTGLVQTDLSTVNIRTDLVQTDLSVVNIRTNLVATDLSIVNMRTDISVSNTADISQADISYLTINNAYSLPTAIGTSAQVLAVPSSGTELEWTAAGGGSTEYFSGHLASDINNLSSNTTLTNLTDDVLRVSTGGTDIFDTATGEFECQVAGVYYLTTQIGLEGTSLIYVAAWFERDTGSGYSFLQGCKENESAGESANRSMLANWVGALSVGDKIRSRGRATASGNWKIIANDDYVRSFFSGWKIA